MDWQGPSGAERDPELIVACTGGFALSSTLNMPSSSATAHGSDGLREITMSASRGAALRFAPNTHSARIAKNTGASLCEKGLARSFLRRDDRDAVELCGMAESIERIEQI